MKENLWDWLFPPKCMFCDRLLEDDEKKEGICKRCEAQVPLIASEGCLICGKRVGKLERYCSDCKETAHEYTRGFILYDYEGKVRHAVAACKYKNRRDHCAWFGRKMYEVYRKELQSIGVEEIIPVPLYNRKERMRGYNQAELVARALSECCGLPLQKALRRVHKTKPQKELDAYHRKKNLTGSFAIATKEALPKRVLLVDDIYTTGSTIDVCAIELKKAGVKEVFFLTIAAGKS